MLVISKVKLVYFIKLDKTTVLNGDKPNHHSHFHNIKTEINWLGFRKKKKCYRNSMALYLLNKITYIIR